MRNISFLLGVLSREKQGHFLAILIFNHVINYIKPVKKTVYNCPTDGVPLDIGNNHGQCGTHAQPFFRTDLNIAVYMNNSFLSFASVNNTFYGYIKNFSQPGQCFNVRLGSAGFPIGYRLPGYT